MRHYQSYVTFLLIAIVSETYTFNFSSIYGEYNMIYCERRIFVCIDVRGFMKMDNFACIKIPVLSIFGSLGYYKSNFRGEHIFKGI